MNKSQIKHKEYSEAISSHIQQKRDKYLYDDLVPITIDYLPVIKKLFKELYDIHKKDNLYWEYCHIAVYKKTFKSRLADYIRQYDNTTDILDFVKAEIKILSQQHVCAEECYKNDTSTCAVTMEIGRLFIGQIDLNEFFSVEHPEFMRTLFFSYKKKLKLLEELETMKTDKERSDSLDALIFTQRYISTVDPQDEPSKERLIELGVLVKKNDGKFDYIKGFYKKIYLEAKNYITGQANLFASNMWENNFINFDSLPKSNKLNFLNKEIDEVFESVNHPAAIDPVSDIESFLSLMLNYKNVLYIHNGVHLYNTLDDFKPSISILVNKIYYDNLIKKQNRITSVIHSSSSLSSNSKSPILCINDTNKKGRPKTIKKNAKEYIKNLDLNEKLVQELKNKYKNCTPKKFIHILIALDKLNNLDFENELATFSAFESYFGGKYGHKSNKYKHLRSPDPKLVEATIEEIKALKQEKTII